MSWFPKAQEALESAERIASTRAAAFTALADRVHTKQTELQALKTQLDQALKDSIDDEKLVEATMETPGEQSRAQELLREVERLTDALATAAAEAARREQLREQETLDHRSRAEALERLEESLRLERNEADRSRTSLKSRVSEVEGRMAVLEGSLRDAHHALLHQPDLAREHIAAMIADIVTPYTQGERPQ